MEQVFSAFLLGLSFGNLWLCALLVFSLQTTNRSTCVGYLVGRGFSIMALAVLVAALGSIVTPGPFWINLTSAVLIIGFAIYMAATQVLGWRPFWVKTKSPQADGHACDGACNTCPSRSLPHMASVCKDCADDKSCAAEQPEVEALTRTARRAWGRRPDTDSSSTGRVGRNSSSGGYLYGFSLGALRGAALCGKLVVLIPILVGTSVAHALCIAGAFALSSSLYPIAGFLFGAYALRLVKFKRHLFVGGCLLLALTGVHFLVKAFAGHQPTPLP